MTFSTKEKLALREAIHAMKWLDKHYDGWGLEEECAILENICSNCGENEIKSNHNYLDLQYQLDSAEAEVSKLQSEIKKNKEELSDYWQVHDEQVTIIKTQTYEIKRLQNEIDIIKKRSEHNDLQDAASARQQMDIIKRLREEIKILKLGENDARTTELADALVDERAKVIMLIEKLQLVANDPDWQSKGLKHDFDWYLAESKKEIESGEPEDQRCRRLEEPNRGTDPEGKIGPDADAKPRSWQITEERKAALKDAIAMFTEAEELIFESDINVLRTMLGEVMGIYSVV